MDHVIGNGSTKCLVVIGVSQETIDQKNGLPLSLEDLEPFGIIPMVHSTGKDVSDALDKISHLTKIQPKTILSDHGSDLWSGVKIFCSQHDSKTIEQYDVCHKVGAELKKLFKNNDDWKEFTKMAAHTKRQLHNTDGVSYAPPNQRRKGRYLNIDILMNWANRILDLKQNISLKTLNKLKWVYEFENEIIIWSQWILIGQLTRNEIRNKGFYENAKDNLLTTFSSIKPLESSKQLINNFIDYVEIESSKLLPGEKSLGSSEMIESLFGYFKKIKHGMWDHCGGIGRLILSIASRVGKLTMEAVKTALELVKISDVNDWIVTSFARISCEF